MGSQEFRNLSNQIDQWRSRMESMRPEYGAQRQALSDWRTNSLQPFTSSIGDYRKSISDWRTQARPDMDLISGEYRSMIADPSKRGFSQDVTNKMFSRQADALSGAKSSYENNVRKQIAATGMGSTGAGIRALQSYAPGHASSLRAAQRDIDLENETLKRSEYFKAMEGLQGTQSYMDELAKSGFGLEGQAVGLQQGAMNQEQSTFSDYLKNLMAETGVVESEGQGYDTQLAALQQANKPGFWSQFLQSLASSAVSGLAGGFGGGLGSSLFKGSSRPSGPVSI